MVTWVLEKDVFAEYQFDEMVAHFKANDIPYRVVTIMPFVHEIFGKVPKLTGPVVCYGSIGIQKIASKHGWKPGVWTNSIAFSEPSAVDHLWDLMVNYKYEEMKLSTVQSKLASLPDPFFIKPSTDTKEFAGTVMTHAKFKKWHEEMMSIGYLESDDFKVVISPVQKLGCEWRVVVVNGKISSSSLYRQYQQVMPERHILPEVEEVVYKAHALYPLPGAYVIDVAQVGDDFKILEFNTFNSSGLYNCDVGKIIDDINKFLEA